MDDTKLGVSDSIYKDICKKCGAKRIDKQLGLEETPEIYVNKLADVFDEVRRVLKKDGTLWLNLGDSYAAQRGGTYQPAETLAGGKSGKMPDGSKTNRDRHDGYNPTRNAMAIGLKHKDLMGIPWMMAFELRKRGWWLRQDIIWHKPNPMPESVTDRCTKAHEYVFLLSNSAKYYFDNEAIQEEATGYDGRKDTKYKGGAKDVSCFEHERWAFKDGKPVRNKRSVWTVNTKPYKEAHFAAFPPGLIKDMVLAGCPENGIVLDCFMGAGTTAVAARKLGRNYLGIELNSEYIALANERIDNELGIFK